jgi:regulator of extracellular matrix RemA (YlzA/DUF370 family)
VTNGVNWFKHNMEYPFVSIGYGSVVSVDKIVAVIGFGSQPSKRLKDEAQKKGKLVDATEGRKTRSLVVMSSDHVILSALACETIAFRLKIQDSKLDIQN